MHIILFLLTFISPVEASNRNWSVGLSHGLSSGAYYDAKATSSHNVSFSYKYKDLNLSARSSYVYPFGFVSDSSYFGLTDISLGASKSLKFMEEFLGFKWQGSLGLVLPTAKKSRKRSKYFALFGNLSYSNKFKDNMSFGLNHTLYSEFYRYQTDISGNPNRLASSSHDAQLTLRTKRLTLTGMGTFYLYAYLADLNPDKDISDIKLKFKAYQGGSLNLSYLFWKKHNLRVNTGWSINIPVVSSVLTGFSVFGKRYWLYNFGLSWSI